MDTATASRSTARRPRLWMIFAAVGLVAVALALGGLVWARLYDNQLIRQTESELIAQGSVLVEAFREEFAERVPDDYGLPVTAPWPFPVPPDSALRPILPTLSFANPVAPPAPAPRLVAMAPDPDARAIGERFAPLLQAVSRSTLAGIRVLDTHGVVAASSRGEVGTSYFDREEAQAALSGRPMSLLRKRLSDGGDAPLQSLSRDTALRVVVALPILEGDRVRGAVLLSRTPMTIAKAFYLDRWNLLSTSLVLLVVIAVVSLAAAALVLRPLRRVVTQAGQIALGEIDGERPIRHPVVREFAQVSESLASMARSLRHRNDYVRSFAANVSHEFKTPLAAIRAAAELLRDCGEAMPPERREQFLRNIDGDAERLTELVRKLLDLARADARSPAGATTPLAPAVESILARARAASIDCAIQGTLPALDVRVDPDALDAALWHLVSNARAHGGPAIRVTLSAALCPESGEARVVVRDDGPGVSEANREHVFDAFFTTARASGGTGLGLTIARSLLAASGGRLTLLPRDGRGAAFEIALARA